MNEDVKSIIESSIDEITREFKEKPDVYLTESDIRCHLFMKLSQHREILQERITLDREFSIPLHTEVRWYGESGKLKYRSDIVILDVATLVVKNAFFRLPSKGYSFNKLKAIIEIKLRRRNGESNNSFVKSIQKDVEKLKKVKEELNLSNNFPLYLLIFDKKENIQRRITTIQDIESIKLKYIYCNEGAYK